MPKITLSTLAYSKADLDNAPRDERLLFLMASSVANDTQMLNKMLAVVTKDEAEGSLIVRQGNSAFGMLVLRMLVGRLNEGWKLVAKNSQLIRNSYSGSLSDEALGGFQGLSTYFNANPCLIRKVRNGVAFHHDPKPVEDAYNALASDADLGDYLYHRVGNTLFYTAEILHYVSLRQMAVADDGVEAVEQLLNDASEQTRNFNDFIFGFSVVFFERHLPLHLKKLRAERETIHVQKFGGLSPSHT